MPKKILTKVKESLGEQLKDNNGDEENICSLSSLPTSRASSSIKINKLQSGKTASATTCSVELETSLQEENKFSLEPVNPTAEVRRSFTIVVKKLNDSQLQIKYKYDNQATASKKYTFSEEQQELNLKDLIPDCNADLSCLVDGSVLIHGCDRACNLSITSDAIISNAKAFSCYRLSLDAKSIVLQHNVKVKNSGALLYKERLDNWSKLKTGTNLDCKGGDRSILNNRGIFYAKEKAQITAHKILNRGLIFAIKDIVINAKKLCNRSLILAIHNLNSLGHELQNSGIMYGREVDLLVHRYLINSNCGTIKSNGDLRLCNTTNSMRALSKIEIDQNGGLINQGKIVAGKNLVARSAWSIVNNADSLIEAASVALSGKELINAGQVLSNGELEVILSAADGYLYNQKSGQIESKNFFCSSNRLVNEGVIHTSNPIEGLLRTLNNQLLGKISSDAKICLMGLKQIINDGLINGDEGVTLSSQSTTFGESSQLIGRKTLLKSDELTTAGEITAQNCRIIAKLFENLPKGEISTEQLKVSIEEQLANQGSLKSKVGTITSCGSVYNQQSGSVLSEQLAIITADLDNEGIISGSEKAELNAVYNFSQNTNAKLVSTEGRVSAFATNLNLAGEISAEIKATLRATKETVITNGAKITSQNAAISGNNIVNAGSVTITDQLSVDADNQLQQTAYASMIAREINVTAYDVINAGTIKAYGELQLKVLNCLENLDLGTIKSQDLIVEVCGAIINSGVIAAESTACLKMKELLKNHTSGVIQAKHFNLFSGWRIENEGALFGDDQLLVETNGVISNYQSGAISAKDSLNLIGKTLDNYGKVHAGNINLFVHDVLQNYQGSKITAEQALNLIGAKLIVNAGELASQQDMEFSSIEKLINLEGAALTTGNELTVIAELLVENYGTIATKDLYLKASKLLLDGTINSDKFFGQAETVVSAGTLDLGATDLTADLVQLDGKLNATSLNVEAKNYLQLLKNAEITCSEASQLLSQAGFINLGKILSHEKLTIIAKELFHDEAAELDARHALFLQAIDLYLDGEIKASQDLFIVAENQFEYKTATLKANGELHLKLADGNSIVHDIRTPGSLRIEFLTENGSWYNEQQLQAGKDITIDIPGFVFVNGRTSLDALIHAQETLRIRAKAIEVAQGSLIANKVDLDSSYNITIKADGTIAGIEGNLHAGDAIEQHGRIEFLKNLSLMAKKAYGHRDSITLIGGDLEVEIDQWILDGLTKVDGDLNAKAINFHLSQYANTLQVPIIYNDSVGQVMVGIQQTDPHTGLLQAKNITLRCETFTQLGGVIKSDGGNTYIEIKGDAFLEGLRTTHTWQGAISALGRNYAIVPVFVPAKIESTGDLTVNSGGKLVGASIELKAVGVKEINATNGISITEKHEYYAPPEYRQRKKKRRFGGLLSIVVSAVASCFIGPAACSLMGVTGAAATLASAAIGGAVSTALNGGKLKDIFKGAAIGAMTAGIMDKLKVKLPAAVAKSQNLTEAAIKNAVRANVAVNNVLRTGVQSGVSTVVHGRGKLDVLSLISSGFTGFAGATIDNKFDKSLFEIAARTGTTTLAHGGNVWRNLSASTAEVVGSYLGERMANEFTSKIDEQRKLAAIKQRAEEAIKNNGIRKDEASSSSSVDGKKVKDKQDEVSSINSSSNKTDRKDPGKKPLFEQSIKSKQQETIDKYDLASHGEATAKQKLLFTIKKELEFQAFIAAQNGIGFDIKQAFEHAKTKINASSFDEIQNIQNVYDYTVHLKSQAQQTAVLRQVSMDREQPIEITSTKYDPESMEILQHTAAGQTFIEILRKSTQTGLNTAKKIPSVYTAWNQYQDKKLQELKQLYEEQALDFEAYLAQQQSKLLAEHTTVCKPRKNFEPGDSVNESSLSFDLQPISESQTTAYDILRMGNRNFNIGLTNFNKQEVTVNPMGISSYSGLNTSAGVSNHFGINVAQIRTKLLNFDLNTLTCNSSIAVNKLLSGISPAAEVQCSLVDAIVTVPKTEILCAYSKCIEMELSSSLKIDTIKLSKTPGIQSNVNPGISTQGQFNIKIVDKPKKKP